MLEFFRSIFAPPRDLILPILAAWLGLLLAERRALRHQISADSMNTVVFYGLIGFVLAGRLFFALGNLPAFLESPLSLFSPNTDLFDVPGACLGAVVTGLVICRRRNLPILNALDALTPFLAVVALGIALMHLAAGSAFGEPSGVAWGIELWGARRHPSQIYEAGAALVTLFLIWYLPVGFRPGIPFLLFISLAAGSRLLLEAFRGDSTFLPGGFRQAQVAALVILAACFILIDTIQSPSAPSN